MSRLPSLVLLALTALICGCSKPSQTEPTQEQRSATRSAQGDTGDFGDSTSTGSTGLSAKRVALVIGNSAYREAPPVNPANDADTVSDMLKSLQFDVTTLKDVSKLQFEDAVDKVCTGLAQGDMCLIYYAGHGQSMGAENFLVPVDAVVNQPQHVKLRCVAVNYLLAALEYSGCSLKVVVVVVDACRNNPFRGFSRSTPGFAALQAAPEGTIVSVSTSPGAVALEGSGNNSPYAKHLVNTLTTQASKSHLVDLFFDTSRAVAKETGQRPILQVDAAMPRFYLDSVDSTEPMRPRPPVESPAPQDTITNLTGMQLKLIPAGSFLMGSPEDEDGRDDDEVQHRVTISKPFYLGIHEVTVGQFRQFVTATGFKTEPETDGKGGYGWNESAGKFEGLDPKYTWQNTGFAQSDSHPVVNVTWNDAMAFCQWLSREQNRAYRLPTEAEWEYACRGGTTGLFWSGSDPERLAEIANVADSTAKKKHSFMSWAITASDGYVFTAPVGRFPANPFGLHDMHGNVYEWCSDWYGKDYYASSPETYLQGPSSGSSRVLRGGSWVDRPGFVRSADRYRFTPVYRNFNGGFRVLCESN